MSDEPLRLPPGYRLDESDPDVVALRRPDGTTAAVFSALGAPPQAIEEAAREDHGPTRPRVSRLEDPQTDREYLDRVAPWNANWAWYRKLFGN